MDRRLIAWGRAVKARRQKRRGAAALPPLWLFTDARRLPDPCAAAAALPRGLAGIVLRHDAALDRAELAHALARICRARRLVLVVAGDTRLAAAVGAGVHLRGGRWPGPRRSAHGPVTSSAHSRAELVRARRAGATLAFLSPAFATASHPGALPLGPLRWGRLALGAGLSICALGGIDGRSVARLPRRYCAGAGAIGALA